MRSDDGPSLVVVDDSRREASTRVRDDGGAGVGADAMSPQVDDAPSIFDGAGEDALLEAKRLVRAGELATRANPADDDFSAFGAVFRAIEGRLELVERWVEGGRQEVLALRAAREGLDDPAGAARP